MYCRTNGSRREVATTVRTDAVQNAFCTLATKCALESADHRVSRIERKVAVTAFAVRSQFEHGVLVVEAEVRRPVLPESGHGVRQARSSCASTLSESEKSFRNPRAPAARREASLLGGPMPMKVNPREVAARPSQTPSPK